MADHTLRELQDTTRSLAVVPSSYDEEANSIEVVFSTGAKVLKYDWRQDTPYIEELPLEGMDVSELNEGAHVLREHGFEGRGLDGVIGSVIPGTASVDLEAQEAKATLQLSRAESDQELVGKIRDSVIRKLSYGYAKLGKYEVSTDEETGFEVRTWAEHRPYEISFVAVPADAGTGTRTQTPNQKEDPMKDRTPDKTPEAGSDVTPEPINLDEIRAAAIADENTRQTDIRSAASKLGLGDTEDTRSMLADPKVTADQARAKLIDMAAQKDEQTPTHPQVRVTRDENDTRFQAQVEGLAFRANPKGKPSDLAKKYVNYRLADHARAMLRAGGVDVDGMADSQVFDEALFGSRAFHTTSDFSSLLVNALNKNFQAGYAAEARNFEAIANKRLITDFRPVYELRLGGFGELSAVAQGDEIPHGTITDGSENWTPQELGKRFSITRKALMNDNVGAFGSIPARLGSMVVRSEKTLFWALLTANAAMSDSENLFSAAHSNWRNSSGGAPSVAQIGHGRSTMRKQTDDDSNILDLIPTHIVIPAALETTVDQLLTTLTPAVATDVTPSAIRSLTPIVEPRLDSNSEKFWYLADANWPCLSYGEGSEGPQILSRESWEVQGIEWKITHDFGVGVSDYRGLYRNKGEA